MAQQDKQELVVSIRMSESQGYSNRLSGTLDIQVQLAKSSARYDDQPFERLAAYESDFAGFVISAYYGNPDFAGGEAYGFRYGYAPEYSIVEVYEAERFARGAKKVQRAYDRLCADMGRPKGLGQEVIYVLKALGIKRAFVPVAPGRTGSYYRDWRPLTTAADIQYHIDQTIADFKEQHCQTSDAA